MSCHFVGSTSLCVGSDVDDSPKVAAATKSPPVRVYELNLGGNAGDIATAADSLADLFKTVDVTSGEVRDGGEDGAHSSGLERLFQLSDTFEWRLEPDAIDDGNNEMGFFATQALSQNAFGPNSSIKLDAA